MDPAKQALSQSLLAIQGGGGAPQPAKTSDLDKARAAAKEFEAVFLSQMLQHMFAGIKTDKVFGGGPGEDIYRSMMVEEYGKVLAQSGGVGITDAVMREIIRIQEAKPQ